MYKSNNRSTHTPLSTAGPRKSGKAASTKPKRTTADDDRLYPLRWRREPRWAGLPSLEGYGGADVWGYKPATQTALRNLRSFGLEARRPLTLGEAHFLLGECLRRAEAEPLDAQQQEHLERVRAWHEDTEGRAYRLWVADVTRRGPFG
jgi:hypothetical protein